MTISPMLNIETSEYDAIEQVIISPILSLPKEYWFNMLSANEYNRLGQTQFLNELYSTATRALMRRIILGYRVRQPIDTVEIVKQRLGQNVSADGRFTLSSSYSGDYVATLCSSYSHIGINLEAERLVVNKKQVAGNILNIEEYGYWLKNGAKVSELIKLWSCKKALLKAEGIGTDSDIDLRDVIKAKRKPLALHSHRLPLNPYTWCSVYSGQECRVSIVLLGSSILEDFLRSRFGSTQVVDQIVRKFSDMGLQPASVRFI